MSLPVGDASFQTTGFKSQGDPDRPGRRRTSPTTSLSGVGSSRLRVGWGDLTLGGGTPHRHSGGTPRKDHVGRDGVSNGRNDTSGLRVRPRVCRRSPRGRVGEPCRVFHQTVSEEPPRTRSTGTSGPSPSRDGVPGLCPEDVYSPVLGEGDQTGITTTVSKKILFWGCKESQVDE